MMLKHKFHLVTESPWPLFSSIAALCLPINGVLYFHGYLKSDFLILISLIFLIFFMGIW